MPETVPSEIARLRAVERYRILDSPPEAAFDRLTRFATRLLGAPIAMVTFVDEQRQWFKSSVGVGVSQAERASSFCAHTIEGSDPFVVQDARADPRFAQAELVLGAPHIRFYAGAPLVTSDGFRLGAVAIADTKPRTLTEADRALLIELAAMAVEQLELRLREQRHSEELAGLNEELRRTDERFELLTRASDTAVWEWDLVTDATWWNGGYLSLFGFRADEVPPGIESWTNLLHPHDLPRVTSGLRAVIDSGQLFWSDSYRLRRKDGNWVEVVDRGYVIQDPQGKPIRMIGAMTDVTDRNRGERAQAAVYRIAEAANSVSTLRELLAAVHATVSALMPARNFYIALHDEATRSLDFPYFVDEREPMIGRQKLGRGLTEYVLRTGQPLLLTERRQFEELLHSGEVEQVGEAASSWIGVPLRTQQRTIGVLVAQSYVEGTFYTEREKDMLQFVSTQLAGAIERKQADEALRESERRFRALTENSSDGIAVFDADLRLRYSSPGTARILGVELVESVNLADFVHPDDRDAVLRGVTEVLSRAAGVPFRTEARVRRGDGTFRTIEAVFNNLLEDPAMRGVVVNFRDVTERKEIEARLIAADRMVSVGTLAAGVAHEINNPLAYVIANLGFASSSLSQALASPGDPRLGEELAESLQAALEGAERVRLIVRDLKTFSRADETKPGAVDLHRVLNATTSLAWNEIRHRGRLVKDYAQSIPAAVGNEARLGQVFLNLLVNAAQAIPEGSADRNEIRIRTRAGQGTVIVEVSDTGPGIAPEHLAQLFDPFFTTKPIGVGTGLGLFICQNIVASMGGSISVDSVPGRGSTFRVVLPAVAGASRERPGEQQPQPAPAARKGRVLIIDDEAQIGSALSRALRAHDVVTLTMASEGLARIRGGERFDVIFCDLMMPQMTGMDFYAALEKEAPEQARRIVFLTGGAFTPAAREFLEAVVNPRMEKPFDLQNVRALLAERLRALE